MQQKITTIQQAAEVAMNQAIIAVDQGSFSVGGLLIDLAGNILKTNHNDVVHNHLVYDPTNHGERIMID